MDIDYIIRLAFTHPENRGRSIRFIARRLNMNPGSVYRVLKRLGLVTPPENPCATETPCCPSCGESLDLTARFPETRPSVPRPALQADFARSAETRNAENNSSATATPATRAANPVIDHLLRRTHFLKEYPDPGDDT